MPATSTVIASSTITEATPPQQPSAAPQPIPAITPITAEPATLVPAPTSTPAVIVIPRTAVPLDNQQRWRAQQIDRKVFEPQRLYIANAAITLLWYDPMVGQSLEIGTIQGEFPAQAQFVLHSNQHPALEVPYRINQDFGLTAISEAVRERMKAAGYQETVEAYVEQSEAIVPK